MIYQNRFIYPSLITPVPANPNDLIYFEAGNGVTTYGPNPTGQIFEFIQPDPLLPPAWYHEGNPIISQDDLSYFGCNIISAANSDIDIISAKKTKGLYELTKTEIAPLTVTVSGSAQINPTQTTISLSGNHSLNLYDRVELIGVSDVPDGIYTVYATPSLSSFTINALTSVSLAQGTVTKVEYFWDEVYTTPLGFYQVVDDALSLGASYEFKLSANNSNQLIIRTPDPSIIPKVGDTLCLQKCNDLMSSPSAVTTDGINQVPNYARQETYLFQIQTVSLTTIPAANPLPALYEYTIELDKSFKPMFDNAIVGTPEVIATGSFDMPAASPGSTALVYVNGLPISTTTVYQLGDTYYDFRDAIIASINSYNSAPEYTAAALTPNGFTIVISAATGSGSTPNGFIVSVTTGGIITVNNFVNMNGGVDEGLGTPGDGKYYFVTLLNREGSTVNKELFIDTWQQKEIHKQQLLGDPYSYNGSLQRTGRKNYLYYGGADGLGVQHLLKDIISANKTPFVMLEYYDEVKDRIYSLTNTVEIDFPNIMLQGETTDTILVNSSVSALLFDDKGVGYYHGLYLKNGNNTSTRYGWVFFDLRIVIIDHPEMATAMGYNSNRNYTLPAVDSFDYVGNTAPYVIGNGAQIIYVTAPAPAGIITYITATAHGLSSNQLYTVSGIVGEPNANVTNMYAKVITPTSFQLFSDIFLTPGNEVIASTAPYFLPLPVSTSLSTSGTIEVSQLDYKYFLTYKINGAHYDTLPYAELIPFNFSNFTNPNLIDNVSPTALVGLTIPSFTHLVDVNNVEGFNAETLELIIGEYDSVTGVKNLVVMNKINLKSSNVQSVSHQLSYSHNEYDIRLQDITTVYLYDLKDNPYQKIYSINPIPSNLFTANNKWFLGNASWQSQITKHRLTLEVLIEADKWNGTTNPSFITGDQLMDKKLISEIAFLIEEGGFTQNEPYIYGKISPPIQKDNLSDVLLSVNLDF